MPVCEANIAAITTWFNQEVGKAISTTFRLPYFPAKQNGEAIKHNY